MINFVMMVGIAGSGKDYFIQKNYPDYVHVSSDAIRAEVFGDVNDQSHNAEVFEIMKKRIIEALKEGKNVVYNATNLSSKRRVAFLKNIAYIPCYKICQIIAPHIEDIYRQNRERNRKVPEEVIKRMVESFQVPSVQEGFDEVRLYRPDYSPTEKGAYIAKLNAVSENMSHDNPHHKLSVGKHMQQAYLNCFFDNEPQFLRAAAMWHDIGKIYTKVYHNTKGVKTDIAHYYCHERVGAYMVLSFLDFDIESILYIALLIEHHMDFFKSEKYLDKIRNFYGENFYKNLLRLHKADVEAH